MFYKILINFLDVKQEKLYQTHEVMKERIENFETEKLKHVEPVQKVVFPTNEEIFKEKVPQMAANFNHSKLNPVKTEVTTNVKGIFTLKRYNQVEEVLEN